MARMLWILHPITFTLSNTACRSMRSCRSPSYDPICIPSRSTGLDSVSYFILRRQLGFLPHHRQLSNLVDGLYRVVIDSDLTPGNLSYGELFIPGETSDTVLFSCHICHPSLANDNLSGIAVATMLACLSKNAPAALQLSFLFIPGTIGSLTWLARNEDKVRSIAYGLVLSCLGDSGGMTYKQSCRGNAPSIAVVAHVLAHDEAPYRITPFVPYGYDERQYCSPGFNLRSAA